MTRKRRSVCNIIYYKQSVAKHGRVAGMASGHGGRRSTGGGGGLNVDTSIDEAHMAAEGGTE